METQEIFVFFQDDIKISLEQCEKHLCIYIEDQGSSEELIKVEGINILTVKKFRKAFASIEDAIEDYEECEDED